MGVLEVGPRNAPNILILNPRTSASAAYFAPLAKLFDYYLGWLDDQSITPHFEFVPDAEVAFAGS